MHQDKAKKVLIFVFCVLLIAWIAGLYLSSVQTRKTVREFYQWGHSDPSLPYDSFSETTAETAAELLARFKQADQPWKKHVRMGVGALKSAGPPWPNYSTSYGAASNGSGFGTAMSLISTHYYAYIRTEMEPGDKAYGIVVIAVETSLFGL